MKWKFTTGMILVVCLTLIMASPLLAGGITVSNAKINTAVSPDKTYTYTMNVENSSDGPTDIGVEVKGYGMSNTKDFAALEPADDTSPESARELLSVNPSSFSLAAGASQGITVTAKIPAGTSNGGRYAAIFIHTVPQGGQQINTISAIAARVLLTISGNSQDTSSQITAVDAAKTTPPQPAGVMITLADKGNFHYEPHIQATLKNGTKIIATGIFTNPGWPILPGYSRQYQINLTGQEAIAAGKYQVDVTVKDDSGKAITSGTFPVTYGVKQAVLTTATSTGAAPASTAAAVTEPSKGTNLAIIVAAVAGVIIVVLLVFVVLLLRKRRI